MQIFSCILDFKSFTHTREHTHTHTREGASKSFYMLLLYWILSSSISPPVSGMLLSVCVSLCVWVCVRETEREKIYVYLGKGASMLKQLDMVAYQSRDRRDRVVWGDTGPHMIPIDLHSHSSGSSKTTMKSPIQYMLSRVLLFSRNYRTSLGYWALRSKAFFIFKERAKTLNLSRREKKKRLNGHGNR